MLRYVEAVKSEWVSNRERERGRGGAMARKRARKRRREGGEEEGEEECEGGRGKGGDYAAMPRLLERGSWIGSWGEVERWLDR